MRRLPLTALMTCLAAACGGSPPPADEPPAVEAASAGSGTGGGENDFQLRDSDTASQARGEQPSEIEATRDEAAMRLFVIDGDDRPIPGIVIKMTDPRGRAFYTAETDSVGYTEMLVPVGRRYQVEYLSLGRRTVTANVEVPEGPNQDIRLTMRYRGRRPLPPAPEPDAPAPEPFVLDGVLFETGRATIQERSFPRLDRVVEYMTHRMSVRIRVEGHTDNVGDPARNQALSEERAEAVRAYLIAHGVEAERVEAVGYGDTRPVASNDTQEGRAQNRRITATEL